MFRLTLRSVFLMAVMAACAAQSTVAQDAAEQTVDPAGTWKWDRTFGDNQMDFTLVLKRDAEGKLAGTYVVKRNDADGESAELDDVKLDGNKLSFSVTRTRNDQGFTVNYAGVVSGDGINGSTSMNFGGQEREFDWVATRVANPTAGADASADATSDPTWTSLFDGTTLNGWERVGNERSLWTVENGALTASGPASMLVHTSGPYKNFRYRAEVKISDGGNSGLYFRTTRKPGFTDGYEAQIDSTHTDPIRTGSLYGMCHVYKQLVKPDTWFTYDLEVRDDVWRGRNMTRVKITVDGNELFEYMDFELTFKDGHFAFQHHDPGSKVSIRKVEVMPLAD